MDKKQMLRSTGILVLSGETTQAILDASEDKPLLVLQDASEILKAIQCNHLIRC